MSYLVLARKYRPQIFSQVIGQDFSVQSLINSLQQQRMHHAYLFTGTRGVGKTSIARILAKALNCQQLQQGEPCGQCDSCLAITAGNFADLIEIDAASKTKVEDTRDLLSNVQYAPTYGRYKIYLIDEVHMLSNHSFNALLKTLEEPPPHVVFLLATTDPQRLPITILSRCLQFHLKKMLPTLIQQQLSTILQQEGITSETQALLPIAEAADGSMRDALSLLDQAIAYCDGDITEDKVRELLGCIAPISLIELMQAIISNKGEQALSWVNQVAERGYDFQQLIDELLKLLHCVALAQIIPSSLDKNNAQTEAIRQLTQQCSAEDIQLYYQIALLSKRDLALAPCPQRGFEMMIVRLLAFQPQQIAVPILQPAPVEKKKLKTM